MILQALLGIELPIIQAPMQGVQASAPAVAVSNATPVSRSRLRKARSASRP
jgi:NAD(P)H-dependent flavin oxidoreductase YrpB (nitropropane dioxygenase family)